MEDGESKGRGRGEEHTGGETGVGEHDYGEEEGLEDGPDSFGQFFRGGCEARVLLDTRERGGDPVAFNGPCDISKGA